MLINLTKKDFIPILQKCRKLTTSKAKQKLVEKGKISAWQVHSYGDINELQCCSVRVPQIKDPDDVLINVEAASVNPIDLFMLAGYGRTLFQIPRRFETELPLTLGRDFSGTVIYKGPNVGDSFNIGDEVYGFVPVHKQGSFGEVVVANKEHICKRPNNLKATECTSLVYATMTAWSALYLFGNLQCTKASGSKVLILGASGGVGTAAVQLLKSQKCIVHGSCSTDAIPLVRSLGADCVFDYKDPDYLENVATEGFYHIVLDCAKFGYDNLPTNWKFGTYITLNSPLFLDSDRLGLVGGLAKSAATLLKYNFGRRKQVRWGFFRPSSTGFRFIHKLIADGQIQPLIHKEFAFEQLPEAFSELKKGHMRGKIVITY